MQGRLEHVISSCVPMKTHRHMLWPYMPLRSLHSWGLTVLTPPSPDCASCQLSSVWQVAFTNFPTKVHRSGQDHQGYWAMALLKVFRRPPHTQVAPGPQPVGCSKTGSPFASPSEESEEWASNEKVADLWLNSSFANDDECECLWIWKPWLFLWRCLLLDVFSFSLALLASDPREKMNFTVMDGRDFSHLPILTSRVSSVCVAKMRDLEAFY